MNSLANSPETALSKEAVLAALQQMELSPTVRGEELTLAQFAGLSEMLL